MSISKIVLYAAGLSNILGILLFSKFLTNNKLGDYDSLFDIRGNILIIVWGLCYIFTSKTYKNPLMIVFFIEKMIYVLNWYIKKKYIIKKSDVDNDLLTFLFLKLYGYVDLTFGFLFLFMFLINID